MHLDERWPELLRSVGRMILAIVLIAGLMISEFLKTTLILLVGILFAGIIGLTRTPLGTKAKGH
jgi:hypothetical protein